jgi:hypothetical protein
LEAHKSIGFHQSQEGWTHGFVGLAQSIWNSCDEIKENFHKCRLFILIWRIVMHARTSMVFFAETKEVFLLYVQHSTQQGILIVEPTKTKQH